MSPVVVIEQMRTRLRPWSVRVPIAIFVGTAAAGGITQLENWFVSPQGPMHMTYEIYKYNFDHHTDLDFAMGFKEAILLGTILTLLTYFSLSYFAGKIYKDRQKTREERDRRIAKKLAAEVEYLRVNPLSRHNLCPSCGWIGQGRIPLPSFTGQRVGGAAAAVGGTGVAVAGCGGTTIGIVLILIGIPLLFFFCIGIVPIIIGTILMTVGGTATQVGTSVAASGVTVGSQAKYAHQAAQNAASQCPVCRNHGLIPANAPMAVHMIESTPAIKAQAEAIAADILSRLPLTISNQPENS